MVPKPNRFHGRSAVSQMKGRSKHGQMMSVKSSPVRSGSPPRIAVVVSKKIDNRAVVRNRIRRRIFEAIRTGGHTSGADTPKDIVVYAKSARLAVAPYAEISAEVTSLL